MVEQLYEVWCGNSLLADNLRIDIAMILVRALFEDWFRETDLEIKVKRKLILETGE